MNTGSDASLSCDHKYIFLREEAEGTNYSSNLATYYDVFFCQRCLAYQRIVTKKTETVYDRTTTTYKRGEVVG